MKPKALPFVLALAFILCANTAHAQNPTGAGPKKARTPDDYRPRTLKELAAAGTAAEGRRDGENGVILFGDELPSRVRVTYTGSTRPLPPTKKDVILRWARQFAGFPERYTVPYQSEMLFIEDGKGYWLAVKERSVPQLSKELKVGETVDLYVIRLGGARAVGGWEWVILVEGFQKQK